MGVDLVFQAEDLQPVEFALLLETLLDVFAVVSKSYGRQKQGY